MHTPSKNSLDFLKSHFYSLLILILLVTITTSCQSKSPVAKKINHELKVNVASEPATLDPRKGGDLTSSCMHFMLFEGLTRLNIDSTTEPAQAEKIDLSPDKLTYTFHIRNSKWSDGTPVTSYDFAKAWKDILDPHFPSINAHLLYAIKNAEAAKKGEVPLDQVGISCPDPKTLVVHLETPTPYFLQLTSFCVLFPVNRHIDRNFPDWAFNANNHFVCNGPFKLAAWKHHSEIQLEKNPLYWNAEKVELSGVRVSMIDNEMTALQMYERGELDILGQPFSPLPADSFIDLVRKKQLQRKPIGASTVCFFNLSQFPFNNINIRKAFALAINRESIVKNVTQLNEPIATGIIPPVLKQNKVVHFYKDDDKTAARAFLEKGLAELEITAADLKEITLTYSNSGSVGSLNHKIAQALQQQWLETLGVQIKMENMENKVFLDKMTKRAYNCALYLWITQYDDQINILDRFKSKANVKNYPGWENTTYAALLDRSAFAANNKERFEILEQAEALMLEEMPLVPIYHWNFAYLVQPYVKNFHITTIGDVQIEKLSIGRR